MATSYAFSDAMENQILDVFFKNTARSIGAGAGGTVWIALATNTLTDASTGASMTEVPNANGYVRATVSFNAAVGGVMTNSSAAIFTASGSAWPAAVYMALVDSATHAAGNILMYDDITDVTLNPGDTLTFAAGQITLTVL